MDAKNSQEERVAYLVQLKARGEKSKTALKSAYLEKFGMPMAAFKKDMDEANRVISEYFSENAEEFRNDVSMHLWDLYAKSYKLQDYRECRALLKQITDLATSAKEFAATKKEEVKVSRLMKLRKAK